MGFEPDGLPSPHPSSNPPEELDPEHNRMLASRSGGIPRFFNAQIQRALDPCSQLLGA